MCRSFSHLIFESDGPIEQSAVGNTRPRALRALNQYYIANIILILGGSSIIAVIILGEFLLTDTIAICLLISVDVLFFPFILGEPSNCFLFSPAACDCAP